jgi:hypothetical protein
MSAATRRSDELFAPVGVCAPPSRKGKAPPVDDRIRRAMMAQQ